MSTAINAQVMAAVASPRRMEILRLVWTEEQAAGAICDAMPGVTFGAVSQHLRQLERAGLVEVRSESRFRYYRARQEALGPLKAVLEQMWDDALGALKRAAEMEAARRGPKPGRQPSPRKKSKRGKS